MHYALTEIAKAAHRLNPALETQGVITFRVLNEPKADWDLWLESVWKPVIGPSFLEALELARLGCLRELAALDVKLEERIKPELAERSRQAGQRFLNSIGGLRGEKGFEKYRELLAGGEASGHWLVGQAIRAAAFHLADPMAHGALFYQEAMGGLFPTYPKRLGVCVETGVKVSSELAGAPKMLRVA